ncbi:MAG: hypothetical protein R2792_11260 [Saprospiraceae bacterium]
MKKIAYFLLLIGLCLSITPAQAQTNRNPEGDFKSNLWYGFGVGIGFSGFNGSSQFGFGVSPMVGYKFLGPLSIGPRASVFYSATKVQGYQTLHTVDTELGAFLRGRVYRGFFLQGEVSTEWLQEPDDFSGNKITKRTYQRGNQLIGAGYNFGSGGDWSSEISILYNVAAANDIYSNQNPWDYRFSFTYRF